MASVIILASIAILVALSTIYLSKHKQEGGCSGCAGCSKNGNCPSQPKDDTLQNK